MRLRRTFLDLPDAATPTPQTLWSLDQSRRVGLFVGRNRVANLAYWVTGTEGSNPSLSAIFIGFFPI